MPSPVPEQLQRLRGVLEPVVTDAGFELDDLEVRAAGRKHTVKVVVDVREPAGAADGGEAEAGPASVGLDAIALLSRSAAEVLDRHEHLIGGSYTLEVTSPGVDRPLTHPRHWRRAYLRLVKVTTVAGDSREVRAGKAGPEAVTVVGAGEKKPAAQELRYADVASAVVQVEFKAPPAVELEALGAGSAASGREEQS